jgi:5'(3')-deoxyribonucleotidase
MKIYLDMDGVVADFTAGLCAAFNIPFTNHPYSMPHGLWDYVEYVKKHYGVPWDQVKQACSDPSFWTELPALPKADRLYNYLSTRHDVQFLTTPTGDPTSVFGGKRRWLEKRGWVMPHDKRMILLEKGETKEQYARPDTVLLDDQDKNVQEFRHGGGLAILVPRPWNNRHRECRGNDQFQAFGEANALALEELKEMS